MAVPLPPQYAAPSIPDFQSCNPVYGEGILVNDCRHVLAHLAIMPISTLSTPLTISYGAKVTPAQV